MQVVYFDGVCNLCNGFVDFLIRRDQLHQLMFAPLQGQAAKQNLPENLYKDLNTVVFVDERGAIFLKSSAAIRCIATLGWPWSAIKLFLFIPSFLRDLAYQLVARSRYFIWGKRSACRLPTAEERNRFLS